MLDFINNLLTIDDITLPTKDESKLLENGNIAEVIYKRLSSTKFRKSATDEKTVKFIKDYIDKAVSKNERIRLYLLFGGYKQAQLLSAPYPDWAEVFNIHFLIRAASSIESIYKPGVDIIYRGDELIVTLMNNYKVSARQEYTQRFNQIIALFNKNIPQNRNVKVRYELTSETLVEDELFELMEKLYPKYEKAFDALSALDKEQRILKSYKNQSWDGEKDLTSLNEEKKREQAKRGAIINSAFLEADVELAKDYFDNGISIVFRKGVPGCIHYGCCSSSTVQFWVGEGFLDIKEDRIIPWILSYEQQQKITSKKVKLGDKNKFASVGLNAINIFGDHR